MCALSVCDSVCLLHLKQCNIYPINLESLASDRAVWRKTCHEAIETFEAGRTKAQEERCQIQHQQQVQASRCCSGGVPCSTCDGSCTSACELIAVHLCLTHHDLRRVRIFVVVYDGFQKKEERCSVAFQEVSRTCDPTADT